jgi:uncharacterized protein YndB with AHSA1/START domain
MMVVMAKLEREQHKMRNKVQVRWILFLAPLLMFGCGSVPPAGDASNALQRPPLPANQINWPARYKPEDAGFFVHNEVIIHAPPTLVWNLLVQAEAWPSFYEGATNVRVLASPDKRLHPDSVFSWSTMDLDFESTVKEFEPPSRLSWESRKSTIKGYHAWLLIPDGAGTKLVTEESQHGFLTLMQKVFVPNKLRHLHDVWLMQIKKLAEKEAGTWIEPTRGQRPEVQSAREAMEVFE